MQPIIEQELERIPSEPYSDLRTVLKRFSLGVRNVLKNNLVGAYIVGSLATGDFDRDSDIDFLILIHEELAAAEVALLQALHLEIHNLGSYPAQHLEGSYMSGDCLTRADLVGVQPLWYLDNGSTTLERSIHDNQWHVRWVLRECAITLIGPDPKVVIKPIPIETLRREMVTSLEKLRTNFVAEIDKPLGWFNTRFGQSFAVLTCCRMLHTLRNGGVTSKLAAARWAEQSLAPEWRKLIRQAWTERKDVRLGMKVRQPAAATLLRETARFVAYAENELDPPR